MPDVNHDTYDHTGIPGVPAAGGVDDPIADIFGAADTDYDAAGIIGLTAIGSPDVESSSIVTDHYYVRDANSSTDLCGRRTTAPSAPFTIITKLSGWNGRANFMKAGIFIGEGTPGNMDLFGAMYSSGRLTNIERVTPTGFTANITGSAVVNITETPMFLGIRVNSSSDVDYLYSFDGRIWMPYLENRNPSITIGSIGVGGRAENAAAVGFAFNYLRLWTSAKSFPGVVD